MRVRAISTVSWFVIVRSEKQAQLIYCTNVTSCQFISVLSKEHAYNFNSELKAHDCYGGP